MIDQITILDSGYLYKPSLLTRLLSCIGIREHRGPNGVVESLLSGLNELGIKYNYNPRYKSDVYKTVVVLGYVDTLKLAIKMKVDGDITRLLAGPNLVVYSTDYESIIGNEYIDTVIVPSSEVKKRYINDLPILKDKVEVWPAGVDINYWKPNHDKKQQALLYVKTGSLKMIKSVEVYLEKHKINYSVIEYGKYNMSEYKRLLSEAAYAIFLSESESQGIALLEAWSMNVPTLVWNPGQVAYEGKLIKNTSSCPYLTQDTGDHWKNLEVFKKKFDTFTSNINQYKPRWWVVNNMTNIHSAIRIINIADKIPE